MELGKNILNRCKQRGITISRLAKLSNVKQPTLHGWTTGRAVKNISDLKRVCSVLEVGLYEILFNESDPFRSVKADFECTIIEGVKITITTIKRGEQEMENLIKISVTLAFLAIASGNLPRVLKTLRKHQISLIRKSEASRWPKAMLLK